MKLPSVAVCRGHSAPLDFLRAQFVDRPPIVACLGARGSGKSFGSALSCHLDSLVYPGIGSRILGGSLAQSAQIHEALGKFDEARPGRTPWKRYNRESVVYRNGSKVAILACSAKSVRGPHVADLRLDEVDEIDSALRDAAMGMSMGLKGVPAMTVLTSTWHKLGGPMSDIVERGRAGEFPLFTMCIWEVLETCPDERSGANLERCDECPLKRWCHEDRDERPDGLPKAKRSAGHYPIDSLIQKVRMVSARVFGADYLCTGPKADGVWFKGFEVGRHVRPDAEYDPALPVYVSIDSGVFTGAVLFQHRPAVGSSPPRINVFGEYLSEGVTAYDAAQRILAEVLERCGPDARRFVSTDSAGGARNPVGPTVIAEYKRAGLVGVRNIEEWPKYAGCVADGLATIEALIETADGTVHLAVHPRCVRTIAALQSYARAKRAGQWQDYPEDPQHPHEDLVDALRGGLKICLPNGLRSATAGFKTVSPRRVFK
ncbi:hypothetical protein [Paludisphaera rhizosphaerae]|uniref:hypothetical protein n=1 Tax=Paludisphaera rhizosphaerae TaxID=2711216 RepID=UPI0013EBA37F|nr:hypothetical protein [Paludisphaera rhizosphaerae]